MINRTFRFSSFATVCLIVGLLSVPRPAPALQPEYWVTYVCGTEICAMGEFGGTEVALTKSINDTNSHPVWSPDAKKIYFAKNSPEQIVWGAETEDPVKANHSDIYVRALDQPAIAFFMGEPLKAVTLPLSSGIGIEIPLKFSQQGNYLFFATELPLLATSRYSAYNTKVLFPKLVDSELVAPPFRAECIIDPNPNLGPDRLILGVGLSPNEMIMAGSSHYTLQDGPETTTGGVKTVPLRREAGITQCRLDDTTKATRVFDHTMSEQDVLRKSAWAYDGSVAINDDGTLYQLSRRALESISALRREDLSLDESVVGLLSPDRRQIAVVGPDIGLVLIDAVTGDMTTIAPQADSGGVWSIDGKRILAVTEDKKALIVNPTRRTERILPVTASRENHVRISPVPVFGLVEATTEPDPDMLVVEGTPPEGTPPGETPPEESPSSPVGAAPATPAASGGCSLTLPLSSE